MTKIKNSNDKLRQAWRYSVTRKEQTAPAVRRTNADKCGIDFYRGAAQGFAINTRFHFQPR